MDTSDARKAIDFIKPKNVIPMHYNTFPLIAAEPKDLLENEVGANIKIMGVGERIHL